MMEFTHLDNDRIRTKQSAHGHEKIGKTQIRTDLESFPDMAHLLNA